MSRYAMKMAVVTCAISALIGVSVVLTRHSRQTFQAIPVRFGEDLEWVDVYLRRDMLADYSDPLQRRSLEAYLGRTPRLIEAWAKLQMANQHWERRRQRDAKIEWERIAHVYSETDVAHAALTNLGDVLKAQNQMSDAIDAYQSLLDLEPPVLHGIDMTDGNYRYHACCELSEIHERNGDLRRAEKYARQAAERETYSDVCGMCAQHVIGELNERVKSLQIRISNSERTKPSPTAGSLDVTNKPVTP